jgi:uncharacterized membrane protein
MVVSKAPLPTYPSQSADGRQPLGTNGNYCIFPATDNMQLISNQELLLVIPILLGTIAYHIFLFRQVRRAPLTTAIGITNHARQMWVKGVIEERRDILAVQTLRNQIMAATFLASTAILISFGSINAAFRPGVFSELYHELNWLGTRTEGLWMFKLMLISIVYFFAFFNFTLAIRYYNHASFMINTKEHDDPTVSTIAVTTILNRGALYYTVGMRGFYLSIPMILWLFGPLWMFGGALVIIAVLHHLDRQA